MTLPDAMTADAGAALVRWELQPLAHHAIVIFGCEPAGLGAVRAAAECGCQPIIVVDEDPGRLLAACELGATHVIDPGVDDPVAAILSLRAHGVRFVFDTTGSGPVRECLARFGVFVTADGRRGTSRSLATDGLACAA